MKKEFFILLLFLPQLALAQQGDDSPPKLLELGFRMNMPFVAMNYYICDVKQYLHKQEYNQETIKLTNEWTKVGYDIIGLYFSAGINFTKTWQFEFRYGRAYRHRVYLDGFTITVGFALKRYSTNRKLYWAFLNVYQYIRTTG